MDETYDIMTFLNSVKHNLLIFTRYMSLRRLF